MKVFTSAIIAASMLVSASALAPAKDDSVLTVGECLAVLRGLTALDHYDHVVKENGRETIVQRQYRLGAMRLQIGLNIAALSRVQDAVEKARNGLILEIGGGKPITDGPDSARFMAAFQKVLDAPCDVSPAKLKAAELKIGDDDNAIPPSAIANLSRILEEK